MRNPNYLSLSRHNVYYFRWPVPSRFLIGMRARFIKVSLNTRNPKEALQLARMLEYHASVLLGYKGTETMNYDEITRLLKSHFSEALKKMETRISSSGPLPPQLLQNFQQMLENYDSAIEENQDEPYWYVKNDELDDLGELSIKPDLSRIIKKNNLSIAEGSLEYDTMQREYKYASRNYIRDVLALNALQRDYSLTAPENTPINPVTAWQHHPLNEVIDKYLGEMERGGKWSIKTARGNANCLNYLKEILGSNFNIGNLGDDEVRKVTDTLMATPVNRTKIKKTRDLSIDMQLRTDAKKLSVGNFNKYIQAYTGLCSWAIKKRYIKGNNPFSNTRLALSKKAKRHPFSKNDIAMILSDLERKQSGLASLETNYWGIYIALYSGARLNEIASLTPADIKQDDESKIWYFDFTDEGEQKSLKNEASKRRVPIHSRLLELGLLEHAKKIEAIGDKNLRLLPTLTYVEGGDGWGRKLGRWANETYLPKLGVKSDMKAFHSFRHSFITYLRQSGVSNPDTRALSGHEAEGTTEAVYFSGHTLSGLQGFLEKLHYGLVK